MQSQLNLLVSFLCSCLVRNHGVFQERGVATREGVSEVQPQAKGPVLLVSKIKRLPKKNLKPLLNLSLCTFPGCFLYMNVVEIYTKICFII